MYELVPSAKKQKLVEAGKVEKGIVAANLKLQRLRCYLRTACETPADFEVSIMDHQLFSVRVDDNVEIDFEADDHCSIRLKKHRAIRIDFHNDNSFYIEGALQYAHQIDVVKEAHAKWSVLCLSIMKQVRMLQKKIPIYDDACQLEIDAYNYLLVMWHLRRIFARDIRKLLWRIIVSDYPANTTSNSAIALSYINVEVDTSE